MSMSIDGVPFIGKDYYPVTGMPITAMDLNGLKLYFEGFFVNISEIGIGEEFGTGTWFDELTQTEGYLTMKAFSWGLDASIGYMNGEIDTDTPLIDFQGWSTPCNVGLGDFGVSEIHNDKGLIGSMWTVDFSPLPASFTFVRGYTNIFGVSNI